jgi:hypothetical protein
MIVRHPSRSRSEAFVGTVPLDIALIGLIVRSRADSYLLTPDMCDNDRVGRCCRHPVEGHYYQQRRPFELLATALLPLVPEDLCRFI